MKFYNTLTGKKEEFVPLNGNKVNMYACGITAIFTLLANKYLKDWTIDRVSKVDKAIISIAVYELLYTETPSIVAINEAIELSKKYSDESVTKMINACLDKIYKNEL